MFAYHVEDFNLYSINYLHAGASKSWYSIKQKDKKRFESLAVSYNVEEHQQCHEFLRHKTKMFSPNKLKEFGIEHSTVVHNAGEFVITFPGAYHAGFNHGLNVAESTNFATPRWFDIGSTAKRCICRPHSVNINVSRLETLYLRKEVKELRDVSYFHTNENAGENSRRYRCVCAADGIFDVEEDSPPSKLCPLCSLWGHTACYDAETETLREAGAPFICFMCAAIESDVMEGPVMEPPAYNSNHLLDVGSSPSSKPIVQRPQRASRKSYELVGGLRKIRKVSKKNVSEVFM